MVARGFCPVGGRCDFMVNGAGHWSLCVTAHYDYFCKTAIIGKSLSWDIKNGVSYTDIGGSSVI